jgi:hypothetical protein
MRKIAILIFLTISFLNTSAENDTKQMVTEFFDSLNCGVNSFRDYLESGLTSIDEDEMKIIKNKFGAYQSSNLTACVESEDRDKVDQYYELLRRDSLISVNLKFSEFLWNFDIRSIGGWSFNGYEIFDRLILNSIVSDSLNFKGLIHILKYFGDGVNHHDFLSHGATPKIKNIFFWMHELQAKSIGLIQFDSIQYCYLFKYDLKKKKGEKLSYKINNLYSIDISKAYSSFFNSSELKYYTRNSHNYLNKHNNTVLEKNLPPKLALWIKKSCRKTSVKKFVESLESPYINQREIRSYNKLISRSNVLKTALLSNQINNLCKLTNEEYLIKIALNNTNKIAGELFLILTKYQDQWVVGDLYFE